VSIFVGALRGMQWISIEQWEMTSTADTFRKYLPSMSWKFPDLKTGVYVAENSALTYFQHQRKGWRFFWTRFYKEGPPPQIIKS
jgi:hypothetical protein